jgi:hypothetical protein
MMFVNPIPDGNGELEARRFLHLLESWPFVRVVRRGRLAFLYGAATDELFCTLDLRTGSLAVAGEQRLDLADPGSRRTAEALIRRHVATERYAPQMREASP